MILEGKSLKAKILEDLTKKISLLDPKPTLVVVQVGDNPASNVYIKQKEKMASSVGINYIYEKLDENYYSK